MSFFFTRYAHHRYLPSFPTRRSSDLFGGGTVRKNMAMLKMLEARGCRQHVRVGDKRRLKVERRHIADRPGEQHAEDRKSTRLNSSHTVISYAVFCLKKKKRQDDSRGF